MILGNLRNILQMQNKKLRNGRSQIRNDNESLIRKTQTQEKDYPKKDKKATNVKVIPTTLFLRRMHIDAPRFFNEDHFNLKLVLIRESQL
jgi:hypothetical protein